MSTFTNAGRVLLAGSIIAVCLTIASRAHAAPSGSKCRVVGCDATELAAIVGAGTCPDITVPQPVCPTPVCPQPVCNMQVPVTPPPVNNVTVTAKVQDCAVCRTHPGGVTVCRKCKVYVGE